MFHLLQILHGSHIPMFVVIVPFVFEPWTRSRQFSFITYNHCFLLTSLFSFLLVRLRENFSALNRNFLFGTEIFCSKQKMSVWAENLEQKISSKTEKQMKSLQICLSNVCINALNRSEKKKLLIQIFWILTIWRCHVQLMWS